MNWEENISGIESLLNYGHYNNFLEYLENIMELRFII